MNSLLVKVWFGAVLSLLSALVPTWLHREKTVISMPQAVLMAPVKVTPAVRKPVVAVRPHVRARLQPLQAMSAVRFELHGRVTANGLPYNQAGLDLWITSPRSQEMRHITTQPDGSFRLTLEMELRANEPVDWEIKAQDVGLKTIHCAGRHIALQGEHSFDVENVLAFTAD
jgi:hypothetical protein